MIGQEKILEYIEKTQIVDLPRFMIINGGRQSGKKTLLKEIAKKIGMTIDVEKGIDSIREMIKNSYEIEVPILYHIKESDSMSIQATNCLLKVVEEPPRRAYFAITATNLDKLLPTIKSRAMILKLSPYSKDGLKEYTLYKSPSISAEDLNSVLLFCKSMGEINYMLGLKSIKAFHDYVSVVFNNIGTPSGVAAFKITNRMKFKEDGEGYDAVFFTDCLAKYARFCMKDDKAYNVKCLKTIEVTLQYKNEMEIRSINRSSTFDIFLLDLRRIWI